MQIKCKNLDLRLRTVLAEIADCLASDGGEFGERAEPVKDAKHRLGRRPFGPSLTGSDPARR